MTAGRKTPVTVIADALSAAQSLGRHPQDHGWRELYRLFAYGLELEAPELSNTIVTFHKARPECSLAHLMTLLGIAVKEVRPDSFDDLIKTEDPSANRLEVLEATLRERGEDVAGILALRQNSFTAARRFLIVQVILGAYFENAAPGSRVNFADIGTGLGLLPRQLNSRRLFNRFSRELLWDGQEPSFRAIPLGARFGVDRGPMPDLRWVHACYGATAYYAALYQELVLSLRLPEVYAADVSYTEFDILDHDALASFVHEQRLNAVNLSYVLYEIEPGRRGNIIEVLRHALHPPKVILITEPVAELAQPGCTVTLYEESTVFPQRLCAVSDGHFRGSVRPLEDYDSFIGRHPIRMRF